MQNYASKPSYGSKPSIISMWGISYWLLKHGKQRVGQLWNWGSMADSQWKIKWYREGERTQGGGKEAQKTESDRKIRFQQEYRSYEKLMESEESHLNMEIL